MATVETVRGREATNTHALRRDVGPLGMLFVSAGSVIGSGWLFGALYASQIAGPAALVAWGIGAAFMLVLALVYAELGGAYPVSGGAARFPHYSHGSTVGYATGWLWWIGAVTLAPIEIEAVLQYFTHYVSWLTTTSGGETVLTTQGYVVAVVLMAIFTVINILGVRHLASSNTPITAWKIAIPILALVTLMVTRFHGANFTHGGFMPYGFHGVFSAMATGGVIFAYQGFEQAVMLGGESSNPKRNIPVAVVYVLLQIAFIAALEPHNLAHGWTKLAFQGLVGPFAGLATATGLGWLAVLLYVDAAVSPGGTGLLYTGTSARVAYALGHEGYLPAILGRLTRRGIPLVPTLISFVVGVLLFLPFPGWQKLVGFITAASNLSYGIAAVSLGALRRQDPERERPFRLPVAGVLAPVGFAVATLIVYWSGWGTVWRIMVALAIGFVVFAAYRIGGDRSRMPRPDLRNAAWLVPYLGGMALISWLGRYDGRNLIPDWWDIGIVVAFSVAIYALAIALRLSDEESRTYVERLDPTAGEDELEGADAALSREPEQDATRRARRRARA